MLRRVIVTGLSTGLLVIAASLSQSSTAQAQPAPTALLDDSVCWIYEDYNAGSPGWSSPPGQTPVPSNSPSLDRFTSGSVSFLPGGEMVITGKRVQGVPGLFMNHRIRRVPCGPPTFTGLNGGVQIPKLKGQLTWYKFDPITGLLIEQNSASKDPLGVGVNIGYGFRPWSNNIVVNPFLSFDYLNLSVNYMFPNGSIIGAKSNYEGTAGVKIGPTFPSGVWLYGLAGVSFLNETLTVNFIPVSSSTTKTVPGVTLGLGGAIQPNWLKVFGLPASLFLEYQHTWWQTANFNMPASSPGFNYGFKRADDTIKLGLNVYLSPPAPPPRRAIITK